MRTDLLERIAAAIRADGTAYSFFKEEGIYNYNYDMSKADIYDEPILIFEEGDVQVITELEYGTLYVTHITSEEHWALQTLLKKKKNQKGENYV